MIKVVLVTCEVRVADKVTSVVENRCPHVTIIARTDGVASGVGAINEHEPDLVIADTRQLPDRVRAH